MRSNEQKYSHYWCHGSLGIMYSRLIWKNLNLTDELNIGESNFTMILEQYKNRSLPEFWIHRITHYAMAILLL